jgi:hypothetical protein
MGIANIAAPNDRQSILSDRSISGGDEHVGRSKRVCADGKGGRGKLTWVQGKEKGKSGGIVRQKDTGYVMPATPSPWASFWTQQGNANRVADGTSLLD